MTKVLAWSKLEEFVDDKSKLDLAQMAESVLDRRENNVGKGKKLLITSIFSFSHIVLKRPDLQVHKNPGLLGKVVFFY